jgi:hypothetical protein
MLFGMNQRLMILSIAKVPKLDIKVNEVEVAALPGCYLLFAVYAGVSS